jgi:hypothetical protein
MFAASALVGLIGTIVVAYALVGLGPADRAVEDPPASAA